MFNLPPGNSVDTEADLSVGQDQMPFETASFLTTSHEQKPHAHTVWSTVDV